MINIFRRGRGGDTFKTPPPYEQLLPLHITCFKMFLDRSFHNPRNPPPILASFTATPLPIHNPSPPPLNVLIIHLPLQLRFLAHKCGRGFDLETILILYFNKFGLEYCVLIKDILNNLLDKNNYHRWPNGLRRQTPRDTRPFSSVEVSGPQQWAWVRIPFLTRYLLCIFNNFSLKYQGYTKQSIRI